MPVDGHSFWSDLDLDTMLLTEVYWSFSKRILRVCFTPLLQSTFQRDPRANVIFKSTETLLQWPAFTNFCVIFLLNTVIRSCTNFLLSFTLPYLRFFPSQQVQPSQSTQQMTLSTFPKIYDVFFTILHKNFGMCNPKTTEYCPRTSLVKS